MQPLFSIIIPHYDIPDLLMRCLKSIPVSEDIQVIVVDDHSPDADTYLERFPELSRPYLEFICAPKNGGAGYARNIGLDHAKGKWLLFADADDFYVDNMYEIITTYVGSKADVIFFRKKNVSSSDIRHELIRQVYLDKIMDTFIQTGDEWSIRTNFYVPYCKMIKMELIVRNNIRFSEVKYANDVFFSICVGYCAKSIVVADKVLYYRTHRPGSLTANYCSKPHELEIRAEEFFRVDKFLLQHGMSREKKIEKYLYLMLKKDRPLFEFYFKNKLEEIYPSKWSAIYSLCKDKGIKFRILLYLYSLWLCITR